MNRRSKVHEISLGHFQTTFHWVLRRKPLDKFSVGKQLNLK